MGAVGKKRWYPFCAGGMAFLYIHEKRRRICMGATVIFPAVILVGIFTISLPHFCYAVPEENHTESVEQGRKLHK